MPRLNKKVVIFLTVGPFTMFLITTHKLNSSKQMAERELSLPTPTLDRELIGTTPSKETKEAEFESLEQFADRVTEWRRANGLVYNRVPKCGSTAVHVTMGNLARQLNFSIHISSIFTQHHLPGTREQSVVARTQTLNKPWIFDRHVFFVNFTAYNAPMPVYINNIRDPVDRRSSWYYFIRFQRNHIRPISEERRMRTYDACVLEGLEECVAVQNFTDYYNYMLVPYFCGHRTLCTQQTRAALEQAKRNVLQHYAVVGLMDDLPNFFSVLEYLLPQYFSGALADYTKHANSLSKKYSTQKHVAASDEAREKMKSLLPMEYEFYNFVKQRFYYILSLVNRLKERDSLHS